jgi:excisionase family DNA binding protein
MHIEFTPAELSAVRSFLASIVEARIAPDAPRRTEQPVHPSSDQLLTIAEAANYLRLSRSAMYSLLDSGRITSCRLPGSGSRCVRRIPMSAVRQLVEQSTVGPGRGGSE